MRVKRHGTPDPPKGSWGTAQERFERIGWIVTPSQCFEWSGGKNGDGYGIFKLKRNGHMTGAHRASWALYVGEIPEGWVVRHKCDNPPCVNPKHLKLGRVQDNIDDCVRRGRRAPQRGDNNHNRKLSMAAARTIRARYTAANVSQQVLANEYNVSQVTISLIIRGKTWIE